MMVAVIVALGLFGLYVFIRATGGIALAIIAAAGIFCVVYTINNLNELDNCTAKTKDLIGCSQKYAIFR